jgi:hypothetical protein
VLDAEQVLGALDRQPLDLVDDPLALVVAAARVALGLLRRVKEAVRVALPTGSNLLLAEVASPGRSRAALHKVTRSPPSELRTGFARQLAARA